MKGSGHKKILNLIPFHPWICHPVSHEKTHGIPWCHHEFLATCCAWSFAAPGSVSFFPGSHSCRLSIFLNKSYQIPTSSCFCSLLWDSTLETSRNISYRSYQTIHAENTPCPKNPRRGCLKFNTTLLDQHFPWSPDNLRNLHRVWNLERLQICYGGLQKKHNQTIRIPRKCKDFNEEISPENPVNFLCPGTKSHFAISSANSFWLLASNSLGGLVDFWDNTSQPTRLIFWIFWIQGS